MIALSGLCLATGRYDSARRILQTFGRYIDGGMLPDAFPGNQNIIQYNSADAALWYIEAWRAYLKHTQDLRSLHKIYPILQRIIISYLKGTRHGIKLDHDDGLIYCGEAKTALTWMNAKIDDEIITPRVGKPVEINALWFNAVNTMTKFAYQLGLNPNPYGDLVKKSLLGFQAFIQPRARGLYDVIGGQDGKDPTTRPNQILAVSLPYSALDPQTMANVVNICKSELLTAYGLRSLSPNHLAYQPRMKGFSQQRERAFHQGSVWAWLIAHFTLAEYRVHRDPLAAQSRLEAFQNHLQTAGLGSISELFDGAAPHAPGGSLSQALSVACVLEAWWRLGKAKKLTLPAETWNFLRQASSEIS